MEKKINICGTIEVNGLSLCNNCGSKMPKAKGFEKEEGNCPWGTCGHCGTHYPQPVLWRKDPNQCGCGKEGCN